MEALPHCMPSGKINLPVLKHFISNTASIICGCQYRLHRDGRNGLACSVSASEVTRLKTRPELNSARAPGARYSTFLKVSCTSSARSW